MGAFHLHCLDCIAVERNHLLPWRIYDCCIPRTTILASQYLGSHGEITYSLYLHPITVGNATFNFDSSSYSGFLHSTICSDFIHRASISTLSNFSLVMMSSQLFFKRSLPPTQLQTHLCHNQTHGHIKQLAMEVHPPPKSQFPTRSKTGTRNTLTSSSSSPI